MNNDKPSINWKHYKEWTVNGLYHRIGGPARIWIDGSESWFVNNKLHRVDGPAYIFCDRYGGILRHWYINDMKITNEVNRWMAKNNLSDWPNWDEETKALFKLTFA